MPANQYAAWMSDQQKSASTQSAHTLANSPATQVLCAFMEVPSHGHLPRNVMSTEGLPRLYLLGDTLAWGRKPYVRHTRLLHITQ